MRTQEEGGHLQARRSLKGTPPSDAVISDFQPPELREYILLFKPPTLWYFVGLLWETNTRSNMRTDSVFSQWGCNVSKCKVCEVRDTGTHLKDSLLPTSEETGHNPKKSMGLLHVAAHLCHLCSRQVPALSFLNTVTRSIPCSNWANRQSHKSEHVLNKTDQSAGRTEQSDQAVYLAEDMLKKSGKGA